MINDDRGGSQMNHRPALRISFGLDRISACQGSSPLVRRGEANPAGAVGKPAAITKPPPEGPGRTPLQGLVYGYPHVAEPFVTEQIHCMGGQQT